MSDIYETYLCGGLTSAAEQFWQLDADDQIRLLNNIPINEVLGFMRIMLRKKEQYDPDGDEYRERERIKREEEDNQPHHD